MQQSDYEIVGKFGFESRTHRLNVLNSIRIKDVFYFYSPLEKDYYIELIQLAWWENIYKIDYFCLKIKNPHNLWG